MHLIFAQLISSNTQEKMLQLPIVAAAAATTRGNMKEKEIHKKL